MTSVVAYWDQYPPPGTGGGGGGISGINVQDEGITIGTPNGITNVNFVGTGVTATAVGSNATVTIPSGGGGAPVNATYVVMSLDPTLTQERVLTAGTNITITDGGANGNVTINAATSPNTFNWGKYIVGKKCWPFG